MLVLQYISGGRPWAGCRPLLGCCVLTYIYGKLCEYALAFLENYTVVCVIIYNLQQSADSVCAHTHTHTCTHVYMYRNKHTQ